MTKTNSAIPYPKNWFKFLLCNSCVHQFYPYTKVPCYSPFDGPLAQSTQKFQHDITFVLIPLFIAPPKKFVGFCASKEQNAVNVLCNWKSNEIALFLRCPILQVTAATYVRDKSIDQWSYLVTILAEPTSITKAALARLWLATSRMNKFNNVSSTSLPFQFVLLAFMLQKLLAKKNPNNSKVRD